MGDKIVVGPISKGLRNDVTPFNIDNDSFPTLINAYQWRGRVKRKRGTELLGRLNRHIGTTDAGGNLVVTILPVPITAGVASFVVGSNVFTDPGGASPVVLLTNGPGTATLDRATGVLTIAGSNALTAVFYFPRLPVMGIEDLNLTATQFPGTIAFDTRYSYNINNTAPYSIYNVSYYKNPPTATYVAYVQKTPTTALWWNGLDYQQFYSINYEGAFWATNGIRIPFSITGVGMQYKFITNIAVVSLGPPGVLTLTIATHGLVVGDFVFINEVPAATLEGINFQTGYVTAVVDANNVTVTFPNATFTGAGGAIAANTAIAQYLTSRSDTTVDNMRWYDGDPTNGSAAAPVIDGTRGWVNFTPPLSRSVFSVAGLPEDNWYLVTARMMIAFKDRILFFGPVVQSKTPGSQVYLQDTIIYSQNGTPFYTASFTGDPSLPTTDFHPILVPDNRSAVPGSFWGDQTGFGGFITAGIDEPILTIGSNEDVIITGFNTIQTRVVYSGNDIVPFNFFIINSEFGSSSTFSAINMDQGVITRGNRGFVITSQTQAQRIDLEIPDEIFEINLQNNGSERFCSQRDFINEWIYFTYPINDDGNKYPDQTLQYNYRDKTWAVFRETYTTYGTYRKQDGFIWSTVGDIFPTWQEWDEPWNAGSSTLLQPLVLAGNQQGFLLIRDQGTGEGDSLYINNIVGNVVTSPDHSLNDNTFIIISGVFGTVSSQVNNKIFSIFNVTADTFELNPPISPAGTYLGGGLIKEMYIPLIQSKQFPTAWGMGRKTRIGMQQYLLTATDDAQIQLLIFLSQNASNAYNTGEIVPSMNTINNSLIYSTVLYTCPESTNLGLTPANINLQMPTAVQQDQIWHRVNTSLIGDTVQVGFTMSDEQMRLLSPTGTTVTITAATAASPVVLDAVNSLNTNTLIKISGVVGMIELNGNTYNITARSDTQITIDVNGSTFTPYVSGGIGTVVAPVTQFDEIELHGFILDVTPSSLLA